ncbi:MAG: histone deacetylase, partial [Chloroflexi bacterium]|nr:histone deacetylase [Chloroflexota bacterium]
MTGKVRNAFCCVRPPGHHATRHAGMGFCIFNNVAVGVQYARQRYGLQRILVVDWDVHHGNGTQDIFEDDPGVFYASSHQAGIYPGTGRFDETGSGPGKGATLNMPLAPFTSSEEFIDLWKSLLLPPMETFRPEFVFISAGFDSHEEDLLGSLGVTTGGFGEMTRLVMSIAHQYAGDRLVSVLEGGYNVDALAASVEAHLLALLEDPGTSA